MCGVSLTRTGLFFFMWGVSLTHPVLFYVGSFSYTPHTVLCGKFLLHAPCCFMWGVSLTRPMLVYVGSFSYTVRADLCGCFSYIAGAYFICRKFIFQALCYLISGICLTHPMQVYVRRFSNSIQCVHSCEEFILYSPYCFYVGNFSYNCTCLVLVYLGSFSCTLSASLYAQFLLHVLCCYLREFLLHAPCCFMWGVSLTRPLLF